MHFVLFAVAAWFAVNLALAAAASLQVRRRERWVGSQAREMVESAELYLGTAPSVGEKASPVGR